MGQVFWNNVTVNFIFNKEKGSISTNDKNLKANLLTVLGIVFRFIITMEKFSIEKLDPNHGKNK